jgi:beta-lactamase superfamily II metal-dependent hydrolase
MASVTHQPPANDELEVSLFGPGYGEAVALHIGCGLWILVDSCISPTSQEPATIQYLKSIGVDPSTSVKLIVVTHWHDDHIRGLASTVNQCNQADLVISDALTKKEFVTLITSYSSHTIPDGTGIDELTRVYQYLYPRREVGARFPNLVFATPNRLLLREELKIGSPGLEAKIFSLSPSDAASLQAKLSFIQLLPRGGNPRSPIASPPQNLTSVALWVDIAGTLILLGADIENTEDPTMGWSAIITNSIVTNSPAQVFKVPHHGSITGHNEQVWNSLLVTNPYALISPFVRGGKLIPTPDDIQRIRALTRNAYVTSLPSFKKWRPRGNVDDLMDQATQSVQEVKLGWGQLRLRKSFLDSSLSCIVDLIGDAMRL